MMGVKPYQINKLADGS